MVTVLSVLFGCSSGDNSSQIISQNLVHLSNGTPKEAREYFESKIKQGDGGLHSFDFEGKTYLMLLEQNRMISTIKEFPDHVSVGTTFNPASPEGEGTYNGENEIQHILYITVIDEINKPLGIFREENSEKVE
ncbi:hypothetical protein [Pontibacillus sp. HMF3514]|uniref:hypothetical protein n=1 Tax=Pontibacillus sp. HMF3514 TaxID=2692425 RepID=UPI00131F6828|nr:hypothetical protein [Pontibacillus sp. HMF3514]QHE52843.1 hypothetical protein GS400_12785 [Pontibacillus sp. HMF3514]